MGCNSKIYLPNDVRAEDVIEAIGYLCGAKRIKMDLRKGSYAASVDRLEVQVEPNKKASLVYIQTTHDMQFFNIIISPTTCDQEHHHGSFFLYPEQKRPNRICIYAGVNEFWHKIGEALINIFGGEMDKNDCDGVEVDYKRKKPRKVNCPSDGKQWHDFQDDLLNLPVLFTPII